MVGPRRAPMRLHGCIGAEAVPAFVTPTSFQDMRAVHFGNIDHSFGVKMATSSSMRQLIRGQLGTNHAVALTDSFPRPDHGTITYSTLQNRDLHHHGTRTV